jgi:hypothetical protein
MLPLRCLWAIWRRWNYKAPQIFVFEIQQYCIVVHWYRKCRSSVRF